MAELRPRAYEYVGERRYVDGVPFGDWMETGEHYVSDQPITENDIPLVRPQLPVTDEALDALVASTRDDLRLLRLGGYEHTGDIIEGLLDAIESLRTMTNSHEEQS